jgi:hypothetical protein
LIASERIGLRGPVHVAGRGGIPVEMMLRTLVVGNNHLFGKGICVEPTHRLCWRTSRHERKAMRSRRASSVWVEASARLISSLHFPCMLVERLRTRRVICRVDDVHDLRCDPAHYELETVLQGHLRCGAPLTSAAHCDEESCRREHRRSRSVHRGWRSNR